MFITANEVRKKNSIPLVFMREKRKFTFFLEFRKKKNNGIFLKNCRKQTKLMKIMIFHRDQMCVCFPNDSCQQSLFKLEV